MTKDKMKELLKIGNAQFYKFYNEMKDKSFITENDSKIYMNKSYFFKGKLTKRYDLEDNPFTRLYHSSIRELYQKCNECCFGQLGYIFLLIPFTNERYNIITLDVFENDLEKIKPLQLYIR